MIIYGFPNDDFARVYCIAKITWLVMKSMFAGRKFPLFQFEIVFNDIWIFPTLKGRRQMCFF